MGKYSNVNASALQTATNDAIRLLKENDLKAIQNNFNSDRILRSSARNVLVDAMGKIISSNNINGSIATLKKKLSTLLRVCDKIDRIHSKESDLKNLQEQLAKFSGSDNTGLDAMSIDVINSAISSTKDHLDLLEQEIDSLLSA